MRYADGFDESEPLGGPKTPQYRFANYIEAALSGPHEPVATQASALLCFQPEVVMEKQITATIAAKPTLVIGFDASRTLVLQRLLNPAAARAWAITPGPDVTVTAGSWTRLDMQYDSGIR